MVIKLFLLLTQCYLFIFFKGGPGSSSMEGAYFENGPYRVLNVNGTKVI